MSLLKGPRTRHRRGKGRSIMQMTGDAIMDPHRIGARAPREWYERTAQILRNEAIEALLSGRPKLSRHLMTRAAAVERDAQELRTSLAQAQAQAPMAQPQMAQPQMA